MSGVFIQLVVKEAPVLSYVLSFSNFPYLKPGADKVLGRYLAVVLSG